MLEEKKNGEYEKYEQKLEEKYGDDYRIDELEGNIEEEYNDKISEEVNSENNTEDFDFTTGEKNHHAKVVTFPDLTRHFFVILAEEVDRRK